MINVLPFSFCTFVRIPESRECSNQILRKNETRQESVILNFHPGHNTKPRKKNKNHQVYWIYIKMILISSAWEKKTLPEFFFYFRLNFSTYSSSIRVFALKSNKKTKKMRKKKRRMKMSNWSFAMNERCYENDYIRVRAHTFALTIYTGSLVLLMMSLAF